MKARSKYWGDGPLQNKHAVEWAEDHCLLPCYEKIEQVVSRVRKAKRDRDSVAMTFVFQRQARAAIAVMVAMLDLGVPPNPHALTLAEEVLHFFYADAYAMGAPPELQRQLEHELMLVSHAWTEATRSRRRGR